MGMIRAVTTGVIAASLLLGACAREASDEVGAPDIGAPSLDGTRVSPIGDAQWRVVGYNSGAQGVVSPVVGTEVNARFGADGRVTGNGGCNQYFAGYELEGQTINIGPAGATRRFCAEPEGSMEQETRYLEALESATTFRLDGARLELRRADGALAVSFNRSDD